GPVRVAGHPAGPDHRVRLRLDAALRAAVRELLRLQKEPGAFEEVEEEPEAPAEVRGPAPEERDGEEDPGLRRAAPAACGDAPVGKTNPIPAAGGRAEVVSSNGVAIESSAPAPGTSACPPPGPRR